MVNRFMKVRRDCRRRADRCVCSAARPSIRTRARQQTSKAVKGAGIGAAAGAVVGLLTKGDKLQNALIGAGVGALAGGGVGYYMDVQEAKLRQRSKARA